MNITLWLREDLGRAEHTASNSVVQRHEFPKHSTHLEYLSKSITPNLGMKVLQMEQLAPKQATDYDCLLLRALGINEF